MRKIKKRKAPVFFQAFVFFIISLVVLFGYLGLSRFFFNNSSIVSPLSLKNIITTENEINTVQLESKLQKNNIAIESISAMPDGLFLIKLSMGEEVILSSKKNIDAQISSLQLILSRLTIEGKRFSRLDFRFDKPVVTLR